ncbi:MAG: phosphoribosyltransferase [Thermoproteota archaeon]|nr:MAG: phosphoribosyltransferase [Candidatus Korarchaeota archaeon]
MQFLKFSLDETIPTAIKLATMVKKSGFVPDIIVAISRGGLVLGRLLSDLLSVSDLRIIRIRRYKGVGEAGELRIDIPILGKLDGKKVLIVDDVADMGDTLLAAIKHIEQRGAEEIKTLTIHYKPWCKVTPDFFIQKTESWVVYWWEYAETARSLFKKMLEKDANRESVLRKLEKDAGIPREVIKWLGLR